MQTEDLETLRSFNRYFTHRIGVLDDRYLGGSRPLGEARVLFEIGTDGAEVREIRERLNLDSGYMSRVLDALHRDDLIEVLPSQQDARVRVARLTKTGRKELSELNQRSIVAVSELTGGLNAEQCSDLVAATRKIQKLLRLSEITIEVVDPSDDDAQYCIARYIDELGDRFLEDLDAAAALLAAPKDLKHPSGSFLLAHLRGKAIGCGAVKTIGSRKGEIKHLWVDPDFRGIGLGDRIFRLLEDEAKELGHNKLYLDSHSSLVEAMKMYGKFGYKETKPYNDNPHAQHWFEKKIVENS